MPAQPKHETLSRLFELLKLLPHNHKATPSELRSQLAELGFSVDLRSVQRDLKELQKHFALDHDDRSRPHGWKWSVEAAKGIASMSVAEALMLVLVQQHLQAALPASQLEGFAPLFTRARQRLEDLGPLAGTRRWPQKVKAVAPGLASVPPSVNPQVQRALAQALLADRQIDATYAPGPQGKERTYHLFPLGLILRGGTTYLAACRNAGGPVALYALHRFRSVETRPELTGFADGFDLDAALQRGCGQFGIATDGAAPIQLVIACEPVLAGLLEESPLAEQQSCKKLEDGRVEVRATVTDSWELRWWLLGRGTDVEVIRPVPLRREIAQKLRAAAARYGSE